MTKAKRLRAAGDTRQLIVHRDVDDLRDRFYTPALFALKPSVVPTADDLIIRDQCATPACTGFALASVIDCQRLRAGSSARVSAGMLFEMAKLHDDYPDDKVSGSTLRGALKGFFHNGVCLETDAPREKTAHFGWELDIATAEKARTISLGAYYRLNHEVNDYHAAVNETGALIVSASIHSGWANPKKGQIRYNTRFEGRHAFAIVGYNESGFLIQNSWGNKWGGAEGLEGVALWTYQDWFENVEDAWVLRLSVSAPKAFDLKFARNHQALGTSDATSVNRAPRRLDIHGHYLHLDDGKFVRSGRYAQNPKAVDATVTLLQENDHYRHVLFFVHGALNSTNSIALRIKAWREVFKKNGIYPIHIMWETGFNNELVDVVNDLLLKTKERMGDNSMHISNRLEELARPLGRKLWRDLKTSAALICSDEQKMEGGEAIKKLICAARDRPTDLSIHFSSASAGVFILPELMRLVSKCKCHVRSANLFAPACGIKYYENNIKPLLGKDLDVINQYSLIDRRESNDSLSLYSKSLLYLVARALEDEDETPLLGMEKGVELLRKGNFSPLHKVYFAGRDTAICDAKTHRGFDRDIKTMNHMLETILGTKPKKSHRFSSSILSGY